MPKVIQLEKVRKRLRDEKANRYNAYTAYVHFLLSPLIRENSELRRVGTKRRGLNSIIKDFK